VTDVVTGVFSYTGRFIAERLLAGGREVRTLSRRPPGRDDLDLSTAPLQFEDVAALVESLKGAETLYNTYWIRFQHAGMTFERAVENTRVLFHAAADAGVARIVHISVTKPADDSPYPYFRGKAAVERIEAAAAPGNPVLDAAGPDTLTFEQLVRTVRAAVGSRARIVRSGVAPALAMTRLAGLFLRDIVLTRDELLGLMDSLLVSEGAPTGSARFGDWLAQNGNELGRSYVSELARNWRRS